VRGKFDPIELERLRESNRVSDVLARFGVRLRRAGREWVGFSIFNKERSPSFTVNDEKGFFHDFSSGTHGDVFDVVMHFKGCTFPEAVEFLGGAQKVTDEDRKRIVAKRKQWDEEEARARESQAARVARAFEAARPITGTHAAAYLEARRLTVDPTWTFDLRFAARLQYRGFKDTEADETEPLGEYPAMVAAIRDAKGRIIGLHRTYLDPERPTKLKPPGDATRNRAKKIMGEQSGGMILLSAVQARMAIGEGIETTRAWMMLDRTSGEIGAAVAVSLGNLAGGAESTEPHPRDPTRRVPNGVPDLERPGIVLPPEVEEAILLGDGDSEAVMTRARLLVAARRFRKQGRDVFVDMAPAGKDFGDILMER
jgi:hypothetical protein